MSTQAISWRTRDRSLIRRVCTYLQIPCSMNVNRVTWLVRPLTDTQRKALQPLVDTREISLLTFAPTEERP